MKKHREDDLVLFHFSGCFYLISRGATVAGRRTSIPPAAAIHGGTCHAACARPLAV